MKSDLTEPAPSRHRRIAVEEAFITPDMVVEVRKLLDGPNQDNLDMEIVRDLCSDPPQGLGKLALERLLDIDDKRIADMDANGVDVELLLLTTPGVQLFDADTATEIAASSNDYLAAAIARHPNRLAGLAVVAPQSPKRAVREMERAKHELNLNGFLINSHTHNEYLDNRKYWPILDAAEALAQPIYIHPRCPSDGMAGPFRDYGTFMKGGGWGFQMETATHAVRMIVSGLFDEFPSLKICLGHMGEGVHFWFKRLDAIMGMAQRWGNVPKLKLSPSEYFLRNFMIATSGVEDHLALQFSIDRLGEDNIMWAIDYPYGQTASAVAFMDSAPISDSLRRKIYSGNAERVFGIAAVEEHPRIAVPSGHASLAT